MRLLLCCSCPALNTLTISFSPFHLINTPTDATCRYMRRKATRSNNNGSRKKQPESGKNGTARVRLKGRAVLNTWVGSMNTNQRAQARNNRTTKMGICAENKRKWTQLVEHTRIMNNRIMSQAAPADWLKPRYPACRVVSMGLSFDFVCVCLIGLGSSAIFGIKLNSFRPRLARIISQCFHRSQIPISDQIVIAAETHFLIAPANLKLKECVCIVCERNWRYSPLSEFHIVFNQCRRHQRKIISSRCVFCLKYRYVYKF